MRHSQLPWRVIENDGAYLKQPAYGRLRIEAGNEQEHVVAVVITDMPDTILPAKANADFMVRACNAYETQLAALKRIEEFLTRNIRFYSAEDATPESPLGQVRAAIAIAEGR